MGKDDRILRPHGQRGGRQLPVPGQGPQLRRERPLVRAGHRPEAAGPGNAHRSHRHCQRSRHRHLLDRARRTGIVAFYDVRHGVKDSGETDTASVAGTETEFVHNNPRGDTTYAYQVRARNGAGASGWTEPTEAIRVLPPLPPTGVQVEIQNEDLVVSWTAPVSGIIGGYQVEHRQQNREQDWTRAETDSGTTSHVHAGPTPGVTYEYRVRTRNAGGYSQWTEPVTGVWYQGAAPPTWFEVQPYTPGNLVVQWGRSATPDVTGYRLRHRVDGGEWTEQTPAGRYGIFSFSPGQEHHEYSVRAMAGDVAGDWSPPHRVSIARPGKAMNLRVNREGSNGVRLQWNAPVSGQPYRYRIEGNFGSGFATLGTVAGYRTTYLVPHQPWDSTHRYRVAGLTQLRMTGPASDMKKVTLPAEPQEFDELPSNLDARVNGGDTVHLTWDAPESRTGTRHRVPDLPEEGLRHPVHRSHLRPRAGETDRERGHRIHRPHRRSRGALRVRGVGIPGEPDPAVHRNQPRNGPRPDLAVKGQHRPPGSAGRPTRHRQVSELNRHHRNRMRKRCRNSPANRQGEAWLRGPATGRPAPRPEGTPPSPRTGDGAETRSESRRDPQAMRYSRRKHLQKSNTPAAQAVKPIHKENQRACRRVALGTERKETGPLPGDHRKRDGQ